MTIEGTLTVSECKFIGGISDEINTRMIAMNGRVNSEEGKMNSSACVWDSSMVSVNGVNASLTSTSSSFINSSYGALSVYDGGEFSGELITFMNNNPGVEYFPSMRYNIICLSTKRISSLVNITSVGEGSDGETVNTSLWINAVDNCTLDGIASSYSSAFYIPTLSGMVITHETSGGVITISGLQFVPCQLSCTITADDQSFDVELNAMNESVAIGVLSESDVLVLEAASDIGAVLNGENGEELTESLPVDLNKNGTSTHSVKSDDGSKEAGHNSLVVILFVVTLLLVVLLLIVIVVCTYLYLKLRRESAQPADKDKVSINAEMVDEKDVEGKGEEGEEMSVDTITVMSPPPPTEMDEHQNRVSEETVIVTKTVRVIKGGEEEDGEGKNEYMNLKEIEELMENGNGEIERKEGEGEEEEQQSVEDPSKRKRKKKKKNTNITSEHTEGEEEDETLREENEEVSTTKRKKKKKKKKKKKTFSEQDDLTE